MAQFEPNSSEKKPKLQEIFMMLGLWSSSETLEDDRAKALYALAYEFYQKAEYTEAKRIFVYLLLGAEFDPKNLIGLGACFHAEKDYGIALNIYRLCIQSGLRHPLVHLHISDCLLHFGNKRQAIMELKKISEISDGSYESDQILTKAKAMINLLELNPVQ